MSLAEDLLATVNVENSIEDNSLTEVESHIIIDETRRIIVPNELKTIAVEGDKDVETVTIDCIRYWDDHDLSTFAIYINYIVAGGVPKTYIPGKITPLDDNKYFSFDWTIGQDVTKATGKLYFNVTAVKTDSEGTLIFQWSSLTNGECTIHSGIGVSNVPNVEAETDLISQILLQIQTLNDSKLDKNSSEATIATIQTDMIANPTKLDIYCHFLEDPNTASGAFFSNSGIDFCGNFFKFGSGGDYINEEAVTYSAGTFRALLTLPDQVGDIEKALDNIISIQNSLIDGESL